MVRSCARRRFAAETIFMALVICCVFLTERMRRRISIKLGMRLCRWVLRHEARLELFDNGLYLGGEVRVQDLLSADFVEHAAVRVIHEAVQLGFELTADMHWQIVQVALGAGPDNHDLLFDGQGLILVLFEDLDEVLAAIELLLRRLVEVAAELGKRGQFAILRQVEAHAAGEGLHGLGLGIAADAGDRDTGVDGRPLVAVEQVGFEKDLSVGNGNDVGGDVGRNVARLGFDEGQGGQRTGAVFVVELGGALQEAAVQVEDVAGEGFAARRAAQQQGDFAIGGGVFGKIVIDAERVAFGIAEVFPDGASGERRQILHGGGVGGRGHHHDAVLHGAVIFQGLDHLGDGGALLADGDIDAGHVAALLIDDGVEGERGLAGLAVADDQLALPAADGDHSIDGLDAGLHRLFDGLAGHHAGGEALDGAELGGEDGAFAVDGDAESVDHAAEEGFAHRDAHDALGAADLIALLNFGEIAEQHGAHLIFFQVHGDAGDVVRELDQLARHDLLEAVDSGDAVTDGDDRADLGDVDGALVVFDFLAQNAGYFVRSNLSHNSFRLSFRGEALPQRQ